MLPYPVSDAFLDCLAEYMLLYGNPLAPTPSGCIQAHARPIYTLSNNTNVFTALGLPADLLRRADARIARYPHGARKAHRLKLNRKRHAKARRASKA